MMQVINSMATALVQLTLKHQGTHLVVSFCGETENRIKYLTMTSTEAYNIISLFCMIFHIHPREKLNLNPQL